MARYGFCWDERDHQERAREDARYGHRSYEDYDRYTDDPCKEAYTEEYDREQRRIYERREEERQQEEAEQEAYNRRVRQQQEEYWEQQCQENYYYNQEETPMPETESLPGLEQPAIKELTDAARTLKEIRKARMEFTKSEVAAAAEVLRLMHANNLEEYRDTNFDPPVECKIVHGKEKVKVKLKDDEDEAEEE